MNNEIKLYEFIKANTNKETGFLAMHDVDVASKLDVSRYTIPNYKKRLVDAGYIETKVKVIENRPITLYRIIKEYTGAPQW